MLANTMPVGLYGVERIPIDPRTDEEIIEESKQRLPIMPVQRRVQAPVKPTKNPVEQAEDLKLIQLEQRLADVDEALKKIPEGQMTDETMWGLGLEDAYKQATAQITAYTKQKDAFIMHRENQERPAGLFASMTSTCTSSVYLYGVCLDFTETLLSFFCPFINFETGPVVSTFNLGDTTFSFSGVSLGRAGVISLG